MKIITGMHRSGTSMISNMLYELGAHFGAKELLLESDRWNERGYFENQEVFILNDYILMGDLAPVYLYRTTPPDDRGPLLNFIMNIVLLRYIPIGLTGGRYIHRRAQRKAAQIRRLDAKYRSMYIKDPRFSLLIGDWARIGEVDRVLYCYRHPVEVAQSVKRRNGTPDWLAYFLWSTHVSQFLASGRGVPTVIVNFNNFFDETERHNEMKRLFNYLGLSYTREHAQAVLDNVLDNRLHKNLHAGQPLPESVDALFRKLNRYHAAHADLTPLEPLDEPAEMARSEVGGAS